MVEKIIITPNKIRGYGNIILPKNVSDFETDLILDTDTETINGESYTIYTLNNEVVSITCTVDNATITLGADITLSATLLDEDDDPITSATVYFRHGAETLGNATTNNNGVATFTYTPLVGGSFSFNASYNGKASSDVSVTVNRLNPSLGLTSTGNNYYGENITFTAILTYNEEGLEGNVVSFQESGTVLGYGITDSNGVATLTLNDLSLGSHTITATSTATDSFNAKTSSSVTVAVNEDNMLQVYSVGLAGNSLTDPNCLGEVSCVPVDTNITCSVNVRTLNNVRVPGLTVQFYKDSTLLGTGVTNDNGNASYTLTSGSSSAEYLLKAVISNQAGYTGTNREFNTILVGGEGSTCEDYI